MITVSWVGWLLAVAGVLGGLSHVFPSGSIWGPILAGLGSTMAALGDSVLRSAPPGGKQP